jgi:excisionase family DNA binding protein
VTELSVPLPAELVEAIAERAATLLLERLEASSPSAGPLLTVPEAAELLRCRRQRVDDLLSQRRLSRVKEGSRTLILRAEVERMLVVEAARGVSPAWPPGARARSGNGVRG